MIAPGSRSTPLALALVERPELNVEVFLDERTAAFAALGWSMSGRDPAIVLCTSGTAATHFHAAVVEADLSGVPLLVVTADRPVELRGIGAPQTIDQVGLYGTVTRLVVELDGDQGDWRAAADQAWAAATSPLRPGPVHLNIGLRDPLAAWHPHTDLPGPPDLPDPSPSPGPTWSRLIRPGRIKRDHVGGRGVAGVILAGEGVESPEAVGRLAAQMNWPVLADPRSRCRHLDQAVCAADSILRSPAVATALRPDVVVQLGMPPASKVVGQWIASSGAHVIAVSPAGLASDPYSVGAQQVHASVAEVCADLLDAAVAADPAWPGRWAAAERAAQAVIESSLDGDSPLTEISVARRLSRLPDGEALVVSSSMPIRDIEWFGAPGRGPRVYSNRGANGIDGVVATAIGVARRGQRTTVLLGDVALCHDASSLAMLAKRTIDLAIVVVDNDGGGIFSFLPQATAVAADRFEQLFGTPHGTDLVALAAAHGIAARTVISRTDLDRYLASGGVRMAVIPSTRQDNVAQHQSLNAAIAGAVQTASS